MHYEHRLCLDFSNLGSTRKVGEAPTCRLLSSVCCRWHTSLPLCCGQTFRVAECVVALRDVHCVSGDEAASRGLPPIAADSVFSTVPFAALFQNLKIRANRVMDDSTSAAVDSTCFSGVSVL